MDYLYEMERNSAVGSDEWKEAHRAGQEASDAYVAARECEWTEERKCRKERMEQEEKERQAEADAKERELEELPRQLLRVANVGRLPDFAVYSGNGREGMHLKNHNSQVLHAALGCRSDNFRILYAVVLGTHPEKTGFWRRHLGDCYHVALLWFRVLWDGEVEPGIFGNLSNYYRHNDESVLSGFGRALHAEMGDESLDWWKWWWKNERQRLFRDP